MRALLLGTMLGLAACSGTQGDVLSRAPADFATAPDLGTTTGSFTCSTGSQAGMCQAEAVWEAEAAKLCQAAGLALKSYAVSMPCADGKSDGAVSYVCCPPEIVMGCVQETQGSADAPLCQSAGSWQMAATVACAASKFVLVALMPLYPGAPCASGQYGGAIYVCCPPS